jgi:hypothetical protein
MNASTPENTELQHAESAIYAVLLNWGMQLSLLVLVFSFAAYLFGLITPLVPLDQLPELWGQPVATYLKNTGTPRGWGWLMLAGKGDMLTLVGIALLAGCSLPPLIGLIALYLKRRDYAYAGICLAILLVLVLAASGVLGGVH